MHPNPAFRKADAAANLAFARTRAFGMLTGAGPDGPLAAHVPFLLHDGVQDAAGGVRVEMHLVCSNPLARALAAGPLTALLAVSGPDGYISPEWYGDPDQVPTWNYVAVHLRGTLRLCGPEGLRAHLDRLSAHLEAGLAPKAPWTSDKMPEGAMERMMRAIVPAELEVTGVDGTWKLNQNKDERARTGAAAQVTGSLGQGLPALAALMRTTPV